jgi:putative ABC transport system permease protein
MMFDLDNLQEIVNTLKENKWRSILTAFGVFWGIFILIILLGTGSGLYHGVMQEFSDLATNSFFIWARPTTKPYKGFARGRKYKFTNDDTQALRRQIADIEYIAPRNQLGGSRGVTNVTHGLKNGAFNINGDYPEIAYIKLMDIIRGRFINHLDLKEKRKVAVIGKRVQQILFTPDEDPIGQYIRVQGVFFRVVGVFESKSEGDEAEEETQTVFIPFSTFQQTFNYGNIVSWFSITSRRSVPASLVESKAMALLARRHQVAPDDAPAMGSWNTEKQFKKMSDLFIGINAMLWFVGISTLIAGAIGVSNIMLVIVKERTKEIGIKRAIGATPFAVTSQIVLESVLLTVVAGYWGLVAGIGTVELVSAGLKAGGGKADLFRNPEVNLSIALTALGILVLSGALAGLIPAHRAMRVKPVEAIRIE